MTCKQVEERKTKSHGRDQVAQFDVALRIERAQLPPMAPALISIDDSPVEFISAVSNCARTDFKKYQHVKPELFGLVQNVGNGGGNQDGSSQGVMDDGSANDDYGDG